MKNPVKNVMTNNRGFSFIELMIGVGVSTAITVGVAQFTAKVFEMIEQTKSRNSLSDYFSNLQALLNDSDRCTKAFSGQPAFQFGVGQHIDPALNLGLSLQTGDLIGPPGKFQYTVTDVHMENLESSTETAAGARSPAKLVVIVAQGPTTIRREFPLTLTAGLLNNGDTVARIRDCQTSNGQRQLPQCPGNAEFFDLGGNADHCQYLSWTTVKSTLSPDVNPLPETIGADGPVEVGVAPGSSSNLLLSHLATRMQWDNDAGTYYACFEDGGDCGLDVDDATPAMNPCSSVATIAFSMPSGTQSQTLSCPSGTVRIGETYSRVFLTPTFAQWNGFYDVMTTETSMRFEVQNPIPVGQRIDLSVECCTPSEVL